MIGAYQGSFTDMLPMLRTAAWTLPGMSQDSVRASEGRSAWRQASGSRAPAPRVPHAPPIPDVSVTRTVDVFLSAGPSEGYSTDSYRSCAPGQTGNCSLWRVRIRLPERTVTTVELVAAASQAHAGTYDVAQIQPAVSPDGSHLSFVSVVQDSENRPQLSVLWSLNLSTGAARQVVAGEGAGGRPQYPVWYSDMVLAYNTTAGYESTMWYGFSWWVFAWAPLGSTGPAGVDSQEAVYEDAHAHRSPRYRGDGDETPRVVTFGGAAAGDHSERTPRVSTLTGASEEVFGLPEDWAVSAPERECHHPAWRPDGQKILCTRYQEPEYDESVVPRGEIRRIYEFGWQDGAWSAPRALVEMLDRDEFATIPTNSGVETLGESPFPSGADGTTPRCQNYVWKFAEWCAESRYLLATIFCTDADSKAHDVLNSRVVLIDLGAANDPADEAADYFDLVTAIEKELGEVIGSWNGIFSTCRDVGIVVPDFEDMDLAQVLGVGA